MLNWPGRNSNPPAGSISSVHTSDASRCTRRTVSKRGRMGSTSTGSTTASTGLAIDIEQLETRRLEAIDQHGHEAQHHGVAERGVLVALAPETACVDADGAHR